MLPRVHALVTGGAGFIGSHLTDRLVAGGHRVTVVDDLSNGREANLAAALASQRCSLHRHDVTAAAGLAELVAAAAPEVVFHLAAQIDVRASVADPVRDAAVNVLGTVAVLEAARLAGVDKVVFASSVAVYGPHAPLPVREDCAPAPLSPYGVSKLAGEQYLRQYQRLHGLAGTTLLFGNVYGPRQDPHGEAGVVAIFTDALLAGRPTRVYGDGGNTRDYVYVGDVVDALLAAAEPGAGDGGRFNIGTGKATSDLELHAAVAEAAAAPHEPAFAPGRPGDLRAMVLDYTAATAQPPAGLGWTPRTTLAEGLARTVARPHTP
jgi:UDP-glucose 4-epimerase